ncbi:MAG: hypothetical protein P4M09_12800 [Devosia sp.]|nr:hypothetical protein [Devosia sp.]
MAAEADPTIIAQLEGYGPVQVRTLMQSGNWPSHLSLMATKWLAQKDQEEREREEALRAREEASRAEEIKLARSASTNAKIATAIAIVAVIISFLAWLFPRQ